MANKRKDTMEIKQILLLHTSVCSPRTPSKKFAISYLPLGPKIKIREEARRQETTDVCLGRTI